MLKIYNKIGKDYQILGVLIPKNGFHIFDIEYDEHIKNLEKHNVISVTAVEKEIKVKPKKMVKPKTAKVNKEKIENKKVSEQDAKSNN